MGSPPQPPTPSSFSLFRRFVAQLAAAPPGRDGSTADSFPFDDNRDEKQKEGILEITKISDVVSEKAAQHDETCLAQVADEEEGSEHNLRTLARSVLDFLSVLKGRAQEGRWAIPQHKPQCRILDSGASMHATGILRLLSEFTRAPGGSSAAVYHTRDGKDLRIAGAGSFSPIDADAIPFFLPVISCGSPGPQKLDVQLERVIAAFDNRKFGPFVTLLAAAPPGRDGSTADSFPFDDNRDEKQKEGILEIIKISDSGSEKAARHDETCLAQVADEEEGSEHNLRTLTRSVLDFLSVLKGRAQEGRSELAQHNLQLILNPIEEKFAAQHNLQLILNPIEEKFAAAFTKERVEICPTRWLVSFASSSTNPGGVAESETSLLLDSGASIHVVGVGEARLLTGIELFSIDEWAVLPDDTRLRIVGTGTMQMDRFSIPKVHLVDGLKMNLISVSQLDKEGRSEHSHLDLILDSGASMHATGNLNLLSEFTRARGSSSGAVYHTRDGKDLRIAGVGMIARDKFHLSNVHYVPELGSRFTLASVQLLAGCDYLVMFCGGRCYVKNRNNGSLVGRGRMHDEDGLYHLEYLRIPLVDHDGAN